MQPAGALPLPAATELIAPARWRCIDFISDLHLSVDTPATFDAWEHYLTHTSADAVLMLGDLFEVWVGDDMRHDAFEARCVHAMAAAAQHRTLAFMAGNRDFLVGAELLGAAGVSRLNDPTLLIAFGQRVLLSHGDALCLDDTDYQAFRRMVRSADWQRDFLAQPLAERQRYAREVRRESEARKRAHASPQDWADVDDTAAAQCLHAAQATDLVHGHTHRPATHDLGDGLQRHVLSDWELDHPPLRAEVLRLTAQGFTRRHLDQDPQPC